jgi:hypothetical protein
MDYLCGLKRLTGRECRSKEVPSSKLVSDLMHYKKMSQRRGVASVELAFVVLFFFIPVLFGIWETGRLIEVQQIVSKSAREGARLAAQGYTINATGAPTQIMAKGGSPNVQDTVYQYLIAAGFTNLQPSDVAVTFAFTDSPNPDPYMGIKNEPFTVAVSIPWSKVRWVNVGLINPSQVSFTVSWQMLIDDAFTINQSMPSL